MLMAKLFTGLLAVVNNAAINAMGDVELMSMEKYKEVADVNLYGMVRVTKAFAPLIRKYRGMISEDIHVTYTHW